MKRILVIDDEPTVRQLLRDMLEREGHEVVEAGNGAEGITLCEASAIDLIITDLIMPEKDGIETIMELQKKKPEVKIIAISGGGRITADRYLMLAQALGVDATFSKPFDHQDLIETVKVLTSN